MYKYETIDLGNYRGETYVVTGFVEPKPLSVEAYDPTADAENYGVSLARSTATHRTNVEILVLDTAHGQAHMDLRYLPDGASAVRKHTLPDWSYMNMKRYILSNWRGYVDRARLYRE